MLKISHLHPIVSNVPTVALNNDPNLCGPGGIVLDSDRTIWVSNSGNRGNSRCLSHYDLQGHPIGQPIPFINTGTIGINPLHHKNY